MVLKCITLWQLSVSLSESWTSLLVHPCCSWEAHASVKRVRTEASDGQVGIVCTALCVIHTCVLHIHSAVFGVLFSGSTECLLIEDEAAKPLKWDVWSSLKNWVRSDGPGVSLVPADSMWNCLSCKSCCGWNFWVTSCWFYALLCSSNVKRFVEFYAFYFVQILILWLVWGWCDVMVIDLAKVKRLCKWMLCRLHASKVSDGCVASFVPCTSPSLKPSPGPLFNLHVCFKRG